MIKQFTIIICTLIIHCLHGQNMTTYILCEGNFGSANSSLWAHNFSSNSSSPIHWDENSNPLGDVGQSLTIHDDKLFIIMNNSHTVEIMDLGNVAEYSHTINLPNASPRYMYAENNIGYISSWGLNAIIVMDLSLMELVDTIQVHGMPEHIINYQEYLYVSVPSKSDWSTNDKILKINSYFIESPDNPYIKDNSIWLTSLNFQPNDAMDCITEVNCSLPFSIHELDKKTFKLKNKYTFSKTVFGLPTVAVPINKTVYMGSFHADRLGSFKIN